jgi:hypothetical protein
MAGAQVTCSGKGGFQSLQSHLQKGKSCSNGENEGLLSSEQPFSADLLHEDREPSHIRHFQQTPYTCSSSKQCCMLEKKH